MTVRTGARPSARLLRFDVVQRTTHWVTALLFAILIFTGLLLYFPSLSDLLGRRAMVAEIHVWTGVALPVPIVVSLFGPWGAQMRRDIRRINVWTRNETQWLRALGRRQAPRVVDKFNPGQKLNAIFIGASIVVMLATGSILKWFRFFPVSWRTGATFVHDVLAFVIMAVILGHIMFAVTHRDAMRSMIKGWVSVAWAARHAPDWLEEDVPRMDHDPLP